MDETAESFERMAVELDYAVFIVTTAVSERREGCVIGFSTQTSLHPQRFLACLSRKNATHGLAQEADALAVHLIPRAARELAELFGGETGDELDKFARCDWRPGPRELPILDACPSWFAGAIVSRHDLGDHEGFLLHPIAARHEPGEHLCFQDAKDIDPGHDP